jgi:hypothetical protein
MKLSFNLWRFLSWLPHFLLFIFKTNVFNFAISIMLSQLGKNDVHPVNLHLYKFSPIEINTKFMTKNFLWLWMLFNNDVMCLKELNIKSSCIQITFNISWPFVFWINTKFNGHYPYPNYGSSSHTILGANRGNQIWTILLLVPYV